MYTEIISGAIVWGFIIVFVKSIFGFIADCISSKKDNNTNPMWGE